MFTNTTCLGTSFLACLTKFKLAINEEISVLLKQKIGLCILCSEKKLMKFLQTNYKCFVNIIPFH